MILTPPTDADLARLHDEVQAYLAFMDEAAADRAPSVPCCANCGHATMWPVPYCHNCPAECFLKEMP